MKVVILGLSSFGVQFARLMHETGHQITLIDRNPVAFGRLPRSVSALHVLGIGIDQDVMRKAGVDQADVFVAATNSDNTNLMAAQVAKVVFNIKRSSYRLVVAVDPCTGQGQIRSEDRRHHHRRAGLGGTSLELHRSRVCPRPVLRRIFSSISSLFSEPDAREAFTDQ